ncbi:MAG: beta-phosphoglucomutase [Chitinophagales bacterium]
MSMIQACIFDLDGVIVDTAKYHFTAWRRMANELGFDFTEKENEELKGVSRMKSLEMILEWGGIKGLSEERKIALATQKNEWYKEFIANMNPSEILPGVVAFIQHLQNQNIKIAIGSASRNTVPVLTAVGLIDRFGSIIDGNKTVNPKPHPEVFLKGAAELGAVPAHTVVFEDAPKGVDAANTGGFYSVGVGSPENLGHANFVISDFEGLTLDQLEKQLA